MEKRQSGILRMMTVFLMAAMSGNGLIKDLPSLPEPRMFLNPTGYRPTRKHIKFKGYMRENLRSSFNKHK